MPRDTIVEPAVVQLHRNTDVLGAKTPRRGDDCPIVHLAAHTLAKRHQNNLATTLVVQLVEQQPGRV